MHKKFDHQEIEKKWQKSWKEHDIYQPDLQNAKKPFYNLMMFPYPSAEGLHVGNMYAFTGADVHGRFQRMHGHDVFEPIGLDGFGIHSENYALKIGKNPREQAKISQEHFYRQLHEIGNGFAWNNKLETYDPAYYKWTQWLFVQMFKHGLAYRGKAMVNWCPKDKTVLADEQVEAGVCERCKTPVERRAMEQWFFKITKYADRLLTNIEKINWPEKIKIAQRQWIGKKEGAIVKFKVQNSKFKVLETFTTRLDTIFGVTFLVVAPEVAKDLLDLVPEQNKKAVEEYIKESLKKTEQQRKVEEKEKTGIDTGLRAINPVNNKEVPIYVADYVLMDVGTGAVMGVPAHDARDFEFAKKHQLYIRSVVIPEITKESVNYDKFKLLLDLYNLQQGDPKNPIMGGTWTPCLLAGKPIKDRTLNLIIDDRYVDWWQQRLHELGFECKKTDKRKDVMVFYKIGTFSIKIELETYSHAEALERLEKKGKPKPDYSFYDIIPPYTEYGTLLFSGKYSGLSSHEAIQQIIADFPQVIQKTYHYHLRDWLISRQRYWGPPIPMINCDKCGWNSVPENELPVILPDIKDWQPKGDGRGPLENAPEDWLYTKCPKCGGQAKRETDVSDTFLDSSWYFLRYPSVNEPSANNEPFDGKLTKKWFPVNAYIGGAEHAVLHLLYARFVWMCLKDWGYLENIESDEPFPFLFSHGLIVKDGAKMSKSRGNVVIPDEYIKKYGADTLRMYLMFLGPYNQGGDFRDTGIAGMRKFLDRIWSILSDSKKVTAQTSPDVTKKLHKTIRDMGNDIGKFEYNTAIARFMELTNILREDNQTISTADAKKMIKLIAPFSPHIAEELWSAFGEKDSIHVQTWPEYDKKYFIEETTTVVVQINGKMRDVLNVQTETSKQQEKIVKLVKNNEKIKQYLENKTIKKTIFVPGKLVNFVV